MPGLTRWREFRSVVADRHQSRVFGLVDVAPADGSRSR